MLRVMLPRLILFALPFAAWFLWREVARRTGRPVGATPWAWLFAAGAVLAAMSLMATVLFRSDNRADTYVPGVTGPDGRVTPGRYEKR